MRITTAERLKQYMDEHNLRQVDICEMCKPIAERYGLKMNRSDISQYVSGKVVPNQYKITVLCEALGVSEAWIMGIDTQQQESNPLTEDEKEMLRRYRSLSDKNRIRADAYLLGMLDTQSK